MPGFLNGFMAAPSAKGDDKFITTDYLQQCPKKFVVGEKISYARLCGDVVFQDDEERFGARQHRCIARALERRKKADVAKSVDAADFKIGVPAGKSAE
ncbi:hypothetical protein NMD36_22740 (plasmid) [Escherichia coli]